MLRIENVKKSFLNHIILDKCNLEIIDGTIFGLVGINGAGKSTLLRSIAGIYTLDEGKITFNDIDTYNNPNIRKDILYLGDDVYYEKNATINSIKQFYATFYEFDEVNYQKYLNIFKLETNKPINNFSKGMKRQVFLLMALAIKPKLLLLDEAFDGLDPLVRLNIKKALFELLNDEEITVIISSHNLKELEDICDSFGILEDGQIKTSGDLNISKEMINKYQIVLHDDVQEDYFKDLDILHYHKIGRVITLVVKGDKEEIVSKLNALNPLILDVININFEELFIYELESRGSLDE